MTDRRSFITKMTKAGLWCTSDRGSLLKIEGGNRIVLYEPTGGSYFSEGIARAGDSDDVIKEAKRVST